MVKKLNVSDFPSWDDYYWTYQYNLARDFYVPMFEGWGIRPEGLKLLDIGCGNGGFTAGLADWGADCVGVEIKPFARKRPEGPRLRYAVQDITAPDAADALGGGYGLVILRDVIEHIPAEGKAAFMSSASGFMKEGGRLLVTFPPFYSPFGLHQQAELATRLRKLPYLSLLPAALLRKLLALAGEPEKSRAATEDIIRSRMTVAGFKKLLKALGLSVFRERHYVIRPSHEIRYGWRTMEAPWGGVPFINELFVLGTAFLVGRKKG